MLLLGACVRAGRFAALDQLSQLNTESPSQSDACTSVLRGIIYNSGRKHQTLNSGSRARLRAGDFGCALGSIVLLLPISSESAGCHQQNTHKSVTAQSLFLKTQSERSRTFVLGVFPAKRIFNHEKQRTNIIDIGSQRKTNQQNVEGEVCRTSLVE